MKAVLLDLDDTLYEYKPCHEEGLSRVLEYLQSDWSLPREEALGLYNQGRDWVHKQLQNTASSHHRLLYMSKLCEFAGRSPVRYAKHLEDIYWEAYFSRMILDENAIPLLTDLQKSGIALGLVTDLVADVQYRKLNHLGLDGFFEAIVTSEEAGVEKPSPVVFRLAFEKLGLTSPEDSVMIGDSYSKDILGATAFGMKAYWVKGDPNKANEMVIPVRNLGELRGILY